MAIASLLFSALPAAFLRKAVFSWRPGPLSIMAVDPSPSEAQADARQQQSLHIKH